MQADPPACDLYISGSDQVWNAALTGNGFDPAYFLKFGDRRIGRITYAVSTRFNGRDAEGTEKALRELLTGLDAISVREENDYGMIKAAAGEIPVKRTLDPTLLLDPESYNAIEDEQLSERAPFIATYCITSATQGKVMAIAERLGEKTGLPLRNLLCYPKMKKDRYKTGICGPKAFLQYIRKAEYLVTDSFHGTVFAILFGKKFVTVPRGNGDTRASALFEELGLQDRLAVTEEGALAAIEGDIDYQSVRQRLEKAKEESLAYLVDCIERCTKRGKE